MRPVRVEGWRWGEGGWGVGGLGNARQELQRRVPYHAATSPGTKSRHWRSRARSDLRML